MAQAAAQCEALGVKTTLVVEDMSTDGSAEGMLLFNFPGMDALVNVGSGQEPLMLPAMERVIGADDLVPRLQAEMRATYGTLCGASKDRRDEMALVAPKLLGETRATYGTLCGAIEQVGATKVMALSPSTLMRCEFMNERQA